MTKLRELSGGETFGEYKVLGEAIVTKTVRHYWVRCSCGLDLQVSRYTLLAGTSTRCKKCSRTGKAFAQVGERFGSWTVLAQAEPQKNGLARVSCECDCGGRLVIPVSQLRNGQRTRCRQCAADSKAQVISPGDTFGEWTVVGLAEKKSSSIRRFNCECSCGRKGTPNVNSLISGLSVRCRSCSKAKSGGMTPDGLRKLPPRYKMTPLGYVLVSGQWDHPNRQKWGGLFEHILVMTELLGRPLTDKENVHHVNGCKWDNTVDGPLDKKMRSGNLELWERSQPKGQRVCDKVAWAWEMIDLYESPDIKVAKAKAWLALYEPSALSKPETEGLYESPVVR